MWHLNANFPADHIFLMFKNFSTLLALRYLNPVRTHVSVITLISLAGVALGVMVLIVVLSVMDGFEDLIKSRVLGREPHIVLAREAQLIDPATGEKEWRDQVAKLEKDKSVTNVYPLVQEYVFVKYNNQYIQSGVKGMDTSDQKTVDEFLELIKPGKGDGDMGAGYVATISSVFAEQSGLRVGDEIEILSTRNIQQLQPIMDQKDYVPLVDQKGAEIDKIIASISKNMTAYEEKEAMLNPLLVVVKNELESWNELEIRTVERGMIEELLTLLTTEDYEDDENGKNFFEKGTRQEVIDKYNELKTLNVYKADSEAISEVALPKDVKIVAEYQTDIYAPGPQMIVPLSLAQEISGVNDTGLVTQIAVHTEDPYLAKQELERLLEEGVIDGSWYTSTWMQMHEKQFSLISSQKSMMIVALSFIILIAVFSIGAVMFTITYQKKKEIGVMKALGATPAQITKVFTLQGVIVGLFGALIGWGLSWIVLENLNIIQDGLAGLGFNPFDKSFYGVDSMPYITNPFEIMLVLVGAFILCTFAALVPAFIASRADAAKSLRSM